MTSAYPPPGADFHAVVSSIEEIIDESRNGRMFILVDDEDRENEGDLVIPAQMATPDAINFMAKYGRGLICLALTQNRIDALKLPLMPQHNASRLQTAFTVSIEAKEGVTTGISASDRARTIAVAIDPTKDFQDIVTPGHVFPLAAREGGVLVRTGHTEAAVDLARLAGLIPAGVICEIMSEDGTMARRDELIAFAQFHQLKIATIADLIAYRRRTELLIERVATQTIQSRHGGEFHCVIYKSHIDQMEQLALVKGDMRNAFNQSGPVLVRMHVMRPFDDMLGSNLAGHEGELQRAMAIIGGAARGIIVILREAPLEKIWTNAFADLPSAIARVIQPSSATIANAQLRDYGIGAQILRDLGVSEMILLTNSEIMPVGLDGYSLSIVGRQAIPNSAF